VAALLLGSAEGVELLGFSEQWPASGWIAHPYRYGGAAIPGRLSPPLAAELGAAALAMGQGAALRGLASADFLVDGDRRWHLLEINPRPGAALDVYERAVERGLIARHVAACRGRKLQPWTPPATAAASTLVYARADLAPIPAGFVWPDWTADRTPAGVAVHRGQPVCTVFGGGRDAGEARALAERRSASILDRLERPEPEEIMPAAGRSSICGPANGDARRSSAPDIAGR
jgi:predicted ATP-grasp superfamily ATP-dependent carboligase